MPVAKNNAARRVLVVDDSLDTAQTLAYLLRDSGHVADYAINGYAALDIAQRHKPDVILLDIGLPDFDGVTLAKRLRAIKGLEHALIVAITGRESEDEERALNGGCDKFLRKPVAPDELEALIEQGLR